MKRFDSRPLEQLPGRSPGLLFATGVLGLFALGACMNTSNAGSAEGQSAVVARPQVRPMEPAARYGAANEAAYAVPNQRRIGQPIFDTRLGTGTGAATTATPDMRRRARELRSSLRAFSGAPPVMPHSMDFGDGQKTCLDCHAQGLVLGARVAHPITHPVLANCVQCHVEATNVYLDSAPKTVNEFTGRPSPGRGARAFEGAPPTVPHSFVMRGACLSCHGEFGYEGLRTDHPARANCTQCHVH